MGSGALRQYVEEGTDCEEKVVAFILACLVALTAVPVGGWAEESRPESKPKEGSAAELAPEALSAILMDADTGTVIYEKTVVKSFLQRASPRL